MHDRTINDEYDIEDIRKTVSELQHILNWYVKRGGLMPYDWIGNGHPIISKLLKQTKVGLDGRLLRKDKRGTWR